MAIKSVTSVLLHLPYDIGGPKQEFLGHTRTHMQMLLVRVENSGGIVGWGEAFSLGASPVTQCAIDKILGPYLIGKDEDNFQPVFEDLRRKLQFFGRGGPLTFAISGLDIALWDLAGKKAGRPLSDLLGGAKRTSLPAYASLMKYATPELLDSACRRAVAKGYQAIKIHEHKVEQAAVARQTLGNEVVLMIDVNCAWNLEETLEYLPRLEELNLRWLEEPVWPPETARNLRVIKSKTSIPLAGGENACSSFAILDLAEAQALDLVQPSVTKIGGVSEMARIADGLKNGCPRLVPHSPYFGPGFLATLHLASTLASEVPIEKYFCDLPASPLGDLIEPKAGRIGVPTGPGIGGEPDPNIIREYQVRAS
jgi:L-alanine-DL-glutamate epimerase-like enolase superfamily enzyme